MSGTFNTYSALSQGSEPNGVFYISSTHTGGAYVNSGPDPKQRIGFQASRASSVFGSSNTVQTASAQLLIIIKI